MRSVFSFRLLGAVLAAVLGFTPLAPPEHAHKLEEHGRHQLVVHRHAEAHQRSHHSPEHQRVLDESETPVLTLTAIYVVPAPAVAVAAPAPVTFVSIEPLEAKTFRAPADYVERLIHGPPRALIPPRAPPSILAS
jgi:hypothetical protein